MRFWLKVKITSFRLPFHPSLCRGLRRANPWPLTFGSQGWVVLSTDRNKNASPWSLPGWKCSPKGRGLTVGTERTLCPGGSEFPMHLFTLGTNSTPGWARGKQALASEAAWEARAGDRPTTGKRVLCVSYFFFFSTDIQLPSPWWCAANWRFSRSLPFYSKINTDAQGLSRVVPRGLLLTFSLLWALTQSVLCLPWHYLLWLSVTSDQLLC